MEQRTRIVAALLAFFFGWCGLHKLYLGQGNMFILYLVFFWTMIPMFLGWIEAGIYITMSESEFTSRYG